MSSPDAVQTKSALSRNASCPLLTPRCGFVHLARDEFATVFLESASGIGSRHFIFDRSDDTWLIGPMCDREEREAWDVILAIHEDNMRRTVKDPMGDHPKCKPRLRDIEFCERCGSVISDIGSGACPAVPPEERWRIVP